jgi:uncharacterized lipoprotein YddW (UPF0748 family)
MTGIALMPKRHLATVVRGLAAVALLAGTAIVNAWAARTPPPSDDTTYVAPGRDSTRAFSDPELEDVAVGADSAKINPDSLAALRASARGIDYLWVLRGALTSPASIDSIVARSVRMNVRGLLVQVVGRGDAYYDSHLLPRAEALTSRSDRDPFAHLVSRAHEEGLEVHAWMNCLLVWSGRKPPRDARHVIRAHPEWVATLHDGRRMSRLGPKTLQRLRVEGAYLAAAHPGVKAWVASIAAEIASRYAVDGIHLDYIRQPDVEVGYDPTTRARFAIESGVDPARMDVVPPSRRAAVRAQWRAFQQRQVTGVVEAVRDSVSRVRGGVRLSAAVVSDTTRSEGLTAQPWRTWVRTGLLDRVYPMCYAPSVQTVMNQLVVFGGELGPTQRVVPGLAVYNTSPATCAIKIKGARALGYPLLALYSYDSLFLREDAWPGLERGLDTASDSNPRRSP